MRTLHLLIILFLFTVSLSEAQVFVASDASGTNDGTSWANAYTDLQIALDDAQNGSKQIWVKSGTYHPTSGSDRSITFIIRNRVELYGGFNGTETSLSERDFRMNETIISGNIGDPNQNTDNSRNLFITSGDHPKLDGITVSDIYDNSSSNSGAVRLSPGNGFQSFTMANCTIKNNTTPNRTAGVFAFNGTINIEHCMFFNNIGNEVIYLAATNANLNVTNNLIFNNNAAGINLNNGQAVTILSNTIYGNQTGIRAFFVPFNLHNNILWNNTVELDILGSVTITNNIIEGTTEPNNFDLDPDFKDSVNGDFKLTTCSAARNLGDNSFIPINLINDILGNDRIFDTDVDLGAFEVQGFPIQINAVETLDIECFGSSSGQIALGVNGGIGTLQYSVDGVNFQTSPIFTSLPSGNYTIEVLDEDSCMDMTSATLNELSASVLTFTTSITNSDCPGSDSGEITISASGGSLPFSYSIDGTTYQTNNIFSGLTGGNYIASVLDAVGCLTNSQITISEPSAFSLNSIVSPISCNGAGDGEISVAATGGSSGYLYNINNGTFGASFTFSDLVPGDYVIGLQDAIGCQYSEIITLSEPTEISISITEVAIDCHGESTGIIAITASGGTAPYEFSLNGTNFQTSNEFTGLNAGDYTVTVKDANICTVSDDVSITEPNQLSISAIFDGSLINLIAAGGISPYEYLLDGAIFQTEPMFTLENGSYTFTVRDANGCEVSTQDATVVTSIDSNLENVINLYPNPVQSKLMISNPTGIKQVRIADFNGKYILTQVGGKKELFIAVNGLKSGIYLLEIQTSDGSVSYQRFVKE